MDKTIILEAIKKARETSPKRNFKQTFDFVINIKGIDIKKTENQLEFFMTLNYPHGKKPKICALVGPELLDEAKKVCDFTIAHDDFQKYIQDKKLAKKLAEEYDFFIAQANIMAKIAGAFGKVLGPRGKMPNPKAGCVVPPKFNLKPLYDKLQNTLKISAKTAPMIQASVGIEDMKDEDIAANVLNIYEQVIHHLPNDKNNIASMYLKLTMGNPTKLVELSGEAKAAEKKKSLLKKHTGSEAAKQEAVA